MKGITNYKMNTRARLKDLKETENVDNVLIKHYQFILDHFDEIVKKHDAEIAKIEEEKALVFKQFVEAPEKLIQLNNHLKELTTKRGDVTTEDSKVKRIRVLRERLSALENQCTSEGINIEDVMKNIEELEKAESQKAESQ